MDPERFRAAYRRLQSLDERLSYKVRPRGHASLSRPSHEQLDDRVKDLAEFTLELKEVVDELFQAIAGRPGGQPAAGEQAPGTPAEAPPDAGGEPDAGS